MHDARADNNQARIAASGVTVQASVTQKQPEVHNVMPVHVKQPSTVSVWERGRARGDRGVGGGGEGMEDTMHMCAMKGSWVS